VKIVAEVSIDLDEKRAVRVEAFTTIENIGDLPGAAAALCDATQSAALNSYEDAVQRRLAVAPGNAPQEPDMRTFGED
jgi:predicted metalloendopeptidase